MSRENVSPAGWIEWRDGAAGGSVVLGGPWTIRQAGAIERLLDRFTPPVAERVEVDLTALEALDTAGAWLVYRTCKRLGADGREVVVTGAREEHDILLREVAGNDNPCEIEPPTENVVVRLLAEVGRETVRLGHETRNLLGFFGIVMSTVGRALVNPRRLRFTSLVYHMEQSGLNALPIIGLISFLIGVVLAYQGATQLRRFGADVFVVDLIGVSILREIGILLTAIVIAGRSGSAFTAQIGAMKVNEEVDAMRTLGLDPVEVLVVPRVLALMITLPLLGFFADIMGLMGGALMAWASLDIQPSLYLERLQQSVTFWTFWTGMIKAPFFAATIAMIGCFEGFQVSGSAESVGRLTTRAVVEAIFLVIIIDAGFSIFFAVVGV
ncbi:MlaE family lipid ABC transporter permease subunit [Oceanibacterium hippocampi]|uniref:Putative phospholipid ABC transporter permease protein MlaE n=1 Tax=Oceanibacterium hippocampi TaxID=745714 RepID=A0A1Y5SE50_9PROT|nr:MlaE family lipid ABC transporter permease subunit [Oceanibacterium hippocampi]SLN37568.1 putative phospholipid ABC transporter permease protein MlaE [Oceanibacterium hippocampi]